MNQAHHNSTITIKLKPYLQEYLICKFNEHIYASSKNIIGALLKPFIEYLPPESIPTFPTGSEYLTITLPWYHEIEQRGAALYISEENQANFQRMLEIHFKDVFYSYMDDKIRYIVPNKDGKIKKCIIQFCSDYEIRYNNINYEMLKKAYYRHSKAREKLKLFSGKLSLMCPLIFL